VAQVTSLSTAVTVTIRASEGLDLAGILFYGREVMMYVYPTCSSGMKACGD
jgi:hypothetical protein